MTGSTGNSHCLASSTLMNLGSSIAGMPSLGGPPERISRYETACLLKSVVNSNCAPAGGGSSREGEGVIVGAFVDWEVWVGARAGSGGSAGVGPVAAPAQALSSTPKIINQLIRGRLTATCPISTPHICRSTDKSE